MDAIVSNVHKVCVSVVVAASLDNPFLRTVWRFLRRRPLENFCR